MDLYVISVNFKIYYAIAHYNVLLMGPKKKHTQKHTLKVSWGYVPFS